ncbi:MAG: rhamnulokinase [Hydrogenoanaerobacterium sp.]
MDYILAIDIGNSSGRHMLGWLEDGKLRMEDIYRFENNIVERDGVLYWDVEALYNHVKAGIKKCKDLGKIPVSIAIDAFGLDYVLLDSEGCRLGDTVCYRDTRTNGMMDEVCSIFGKKRLYEHTGIQFMRFNTLYQLYYLAKYQPEQLRKAKDLLLLPNYFAYRMTGIKANEYTNATTTQLVNLASKNWDTDILKAVGIPADILCPILPAGTNIGFLTAEVQQEVGFNAQVILPPTHDTASAYVAAPNNSGDNIILSSGTWSLLGAETMSPICTDDACKENFTNEGGYEYRYRYLKNITGMWMLQEIRRNYKNIYDFGTLTELASKCSLFNSYVDVTLDIFTKPESMVEAIRKECFRTGQIVPETPGEVCKCVVNSLALDYKKKIAALEQTAGRTYEKILIVGGGSRNGLLNQAVANSSGKTVLAGLTEATAIGNIICQMITLKLIPNLEAGRNIVAESFPLEAYSPQ